MRIACPACAATYEVPAGLLAAGQRVACARCGEHWTPLPAAGPPVSDLAIPAVPPRSEPVRPAPSPPARPTPPQQPSLSPSLARSSSLAQPPGALRPSNPPLPLSAPPDRLPADAEPTRPDWFPRVAGDWASAEQRWPLVPLAWIGSVAVLLALLGAGVGARDRLMAAWPPTSRLFSAVGLDDR